MYLTRYVRWLGRFSRNANVAEGCGIVFALLLVPLIGILLVIYLPFAWLADLNEQFQKTQKVNYSNRRFP